MTTEFSDARNNPWLCIPANEYDEHMANPAVGQRAFLDRVFAQALAEHSPRSVLLLGCATGGGLDLVAGNQCERVTAVDINPEYLQVARTRFGARLPKLELIEADIESFELDDGAYDLVHCALVLEYVDPEIVMSRVARWLSGHGVLVVVLQLSSKDLATITLTKSESLKLLAPAMRLRRPESIQQLAKRAGLEERTSSIERLDTGKEFCIVQYCLSKLSSSQKASASKSGQ